MCARSRHPPTRPSYLLRRGRSWWPALLPGHRLGWGDGCLWGSVEVGWGGFLQTPDPNPTSGSAEGRSRLEVSRPSAATLRLSTISRAFNGDHDRFVPRSLRLVQEERPPVSQRL